LEIHITMHKTLLLATLLFSSASFAQEAVTPEAPAAAASASASVPPASLISRIRLFGQNGATAFLYRDSSCIRGFFSDGVEKASGSMSAAFGSFIGQVSNESLGIPDTETSLNLSDKSLLLSKAYFREYEIPAGKPSSLRLGFQNVSSFYVMNGVSHETRGSSCSGDISFTPRAGADYEASFSWEGRLCRTGVNEVVVKDGKTELIPVPVTAAPGC
jgi:hypothetical protein